MRMARRPRSIRHLVVVADRPWPPSIEASAVTTPGPTQAEREQLWTRIERALHAHGAQAHDPEGHAAGE